MRHRWYTKRMTKIETENLIEIEELEQKIAPDDNGETVLPL